MKASTLAAAFGEAPPPTDEDLDTYAEGSEAKKPEDAEGADAALDAAVEVLSDASASKETKREALRSAILACC